MSESTRGEGSGGVLVAREENDNATSSQPRRRVVESIGSHWPRGANGDRA
eukprot:CAMPEP_0119476292 /NCGR_PEP_ID=MMETSP1344-20130328/6863_1 /TAXON_ID=236787 /ORGANISM="Florenciella parvula, Strain CCMP2471" /LENGTH=49 /DNA_ID=CAMNT_0007510015 /DNA_START=413 /DNA_END=562 /DNA_ORIENTATION=+